MLWQIFVFVNVIASAVQTLFQKRIADVKPDPLNFTILTQFSAGILIAIYAAFQGLNFTGIWHYWPNLILMVFFWSGFNIINIVALGKVQASHFMILFQTKVIWTLLIAILVLRESFLPKNFLGLFLIVAAIVIITPLKHFQKLGKGDVYVFLAALCFGLGVGNDAFVLKGIASPVSYATVTCLTPPIILALMFPKNLAKFDYLKVKRTLTDFVLMSVLFAVSLIAAYSAYKYGNAAIVAPLTQTAAIVTVILSIIFLGERDRPVAKISAILVSFVGVLLLI